MSKVLLGIGIISFWLIFAFGMMYIDSSSSYNVDNYISQSKNMQNPTLINILSSWFNGLIFFFKAMFLIMPNIPSIFRLITNVLQAMSLVFVLLLLRG